MNELAEPFDMSLPAVSKHLKVLEKAQLIARGREAQWRPCKLKAAPLKDAADWLEHYRRFWEQSFDRLDDYLREVQAKEKKRAAEEIGRFGMLLSYWRRRVFSKVREKVWRDCRSARGSVDVSVKPTRSDRS